MVSERRLCVLSDRHGSTPTADEVWRDDVAVAFLDRAPLFPGHVLVVPVDHVVTLPELVEVGPFFERVQRIAAVMPHALGAQGTFVANNNTVSQSVAHLHVHVVPRTKGDGLRGFFWPRARYEEGEAAVGRGAVAHRARPGLTRARRSISVIGRTTASPFTARDCALRGPRIAYRTSPRASSVAVATIGVLAPHPAATLTWSRRNEAARASELGGPVAGPTRLALERGPT